MPINAQRYFIMEVSTLGGVSKLPGDCFGEHTVILDMLHLARQIFGDTDLQREVLCLFRSESANYLDAISSAEDERALHRALHTLKGAASAIGANRLADQAGHFEHCVADLIGEHRQPMIRALETRIAEVNGFIAATVDCPA